jgi:hypothetical protein
MADRSGAIRATRQERIRLGGRELEYRLVSSKSAKKLRVKIAPDGMQVILPTARRPDEARAFLLENEAWVIKQLARMERYQSVRKPEVAAAGEILFRGEPTPIRVATAKGWKGPSRVRHDANGILVQRSQNTRTLPEGKRSAPSGERASCPQPLGRGHPGHREGETPALPGGLNAYAGGNAGKLAAEASQASHPAPCR